MFSKTAKDFHVLFFDEETQEWNLVNKHGMLFHEANELKEKYEKRSILSKVIDVNLVEEFMKYANGQYKNKESQIPD